MTGDVRLSPDGGSIPPSRAGRGLAKVTVVVAAIAGVLSIAALSVAIMRPAGSIPPTTITTQPYNPAQISAAHAHLCDTYKLASRAVQIDTNGSDKALARSATTNAAVMLENAAADLALDAKPRDAARELSAAYLTATAKATNGVVSDSEWQAALDEVIAKDAAMKQVCGGS
ncbi:hypothetical protein ACKUUI_22085 [Mycobacterium seoulense]|uniref:hypothetical protein n=1 Tax=Mycobacterium seoulense TaxID=386911 RepID=UPI003CFABD1E